MLWDDSIHDHKQTNKLKRKPEEEAEKDKKDNGMQHFEKITILSFNALSVVKEAKRNKCLSLRRQLKECRFIILLAIMHVEM